MITFPEKIFVTGTGTDVGKTFVSAMLLCGLDASYWKPVQSGRPTDSDFLKSVTHQPLSKFKTETYTFEDPVSPHLAAEIANVQIDLEQFQIPDCADKHLIVEGAGGLLVPLNARHMMIDLIVRLNLPTLIVAHSTLGTINHTLLTLKELRSRSVDVLGIVLNGPKNPANRAAIERYGDARVIGECDILPEISPLSLKDAFSRCFEEKIKCTTGPSLDFTPPFR
jgi:dethiobiotin synthetase